MARNGHSPPGGATFHDSISKGSWRERKAEDIGTYLEEPPRDWDHLEIGQKLDEVCR